MQSITFAALTTVAAAISADELEFTNYVARFNKVYEDIEEFAMRFERFVYWHRVIKEHNSTNGPNFILGHNQFSDWTNEEYAAILTYGASDNKNDEDENTEIYQDCSVDTDNDISDYVNWPWNRTVDWAEAGAVTPVKDQGRCGSCWAFASIGALEGAYFVKHKELLAFSEQQLIDCATKPEDRGYYNRGCKGGDMARALCYLKDNFAMLEGDYPFTSGSTG